MIIFFTSYNFYLHQGETKKSDIERLAFIFFCVLARTVCFTTTRNHHPKEPTEKKGDDRNIQVMRRAYSGGDRPMPSAFGRRRRVGIAKKNEHTSSQGGGKVEV